MELHSLKAAEGSRKVRNRVGRGTSSGNGKTSGRGQKGQKSRSGGGVRPGFEGGQTELFRRMPKRGFLNVNRKEYAIVNLETLNRLEDGATVSAETLVAAKIIKDVKSGVKVLANGELTAKKLTVKVAKVSAAAKAAIEAAGGSVEEAYFVHYNWRLNFQPLIVYLQLKRFKEILCFLRRLRKPLRSRTSEQEFSLRFSSFLFSA